MATMPYTGSYSAPQLVFAGLTIPPAKSINAAAGQQRTVAVAADRALVPLTYGEDRATALILNVLISGTDPGLMLVQCLWGHALDAISAIKLNGEALPSGATVTHYTGNQSTADAALVAAFAAQSITYTDTLAGYAYSVVALPVVAFSGQLTITATLRGRKVYDPRKDSTAGGSGSHRLATPATWEWSDCPALCLADWIANATYGAGESVDWASVPAAANANDTIVGSAPGEKRRLLGLTINSAAQVADMAEALRAYAGCWLVPTGDGVRLLPDADASPAATYSHASGNIAALSPLQLPDRAAAPTVVEVVYSDISTGERRDASAEAALPGVGTTLPYRRSTVRLPGIQRYSQANREAIERLNKLSLEGVATTLETFDEGIQHQPGDIIAVTHPVGLSATTMRVVAVDLAGPGRWLLDLMRHDPASYSSSVVVAGTIADPSRRINPGPASDVTGAAATVSSGLIRVTWAPCPDTGYDSTEVRTADANWGSYAVAPLFRAKASEFPYLVTATGSYTFHLRHISNGNPSANTVTVTLVVTPGDLSTTLALFFSPPSVNLSYLPGVGITNISQASTQIIVRDSSGTDMTANYDFAKTDNGVTSTLSGTTLTIDNVGSGGAAPYVVFFARLNGTIVDEGPYALAGTKGGDVTISASGGPFASTGCAVFNGAASPWGDDGQINYLVPAEITPTDVNTSLSLWVKINNVNSGTFQPLVGLGPFWNIEFYGSGWTGGLPTITFNWFGFRENISNNSTSPTAFESLNAATSALTSNTWHFIEAVYDKSSSKMILFIDGAKIAEKTTSPAGAGLGLIWQRNAVYGQNHATVLRIGRNFGAGYSYGTYGAIAEVCLQVGGAVPTSSYTKPTATRGAVVPPATASVLVTATPKAGGSSISNSFYAYTARAAAPVVVVVPSRTTGIVEADWDNSNQSYSQTAMTYQVLVDGVDQTAQWQARGIHNAPSADMGMTLSRGSFVVTSKASSSNITATINIGRPGYRTQVLEYLISTSYRGQKTVIPGGTSALTVQATWDDGARLNLPLSASVTALDGNTVVTSSYTWGVSASSGLTLSASSGSSVNLTGMASGTSAGTITFTGTRSNWPTLTWTVTVTKVLAAQPVVLPSGTTSLGVAATWDDASNTNLPLAGSVAAIEQGSNANVTSSYAWTATGSAGLTVTNTGAAFSLTGMASGTLTGTVTMTGTRASWPTLTWTTSVTKALAAQASVTTTGPTSIGVFATWDDATLLFLPIGGSIVAIDQATGATVTSSYTWSSAASSGLTATNSGAQFSISAMAAGVMAGTITMTGTRSGWPTVTHVIAVQKTLQAQPTVAASGTATLQVRANWDDTSRLNLPLSGAVVATDQATGTAVTSSYTWVATATSGISVTNTGASFSVTAMASGTNTGTVTMTGTRTGWPTLTWATGITKVLDAQPVVVAGGPSAITIAGSTDGSVPSINLPVTATVTATDAGTSVAGSYSWSVSASSGITASISSGSTVQVTAMTDSTDTGTLTVTGTRSGWPTLTWVIAVTKTRLLAPYNKVVPIIPAINAFVTNSGTASADVRFNTDGTIQRRSNGGSWSSAGQWFNPTGGTPGNTHDIFRAGTWQALSSAVTYSASATGDGNSDTLQDTLLIAASSDRSTILGSCQVFLYVYVNPA